MADDAPQADAEAGKFTHFLDDTSFTAMYQKLVEAARRSFLSFLFLLFPQSPGAGYIIGAVHAYLARKVQAVMDGQASARQAISMPPQHGKSRLIAVRMVAWLVGAHPGKCIALTGFNHTLLTDFIKEIRAIMQTPAYQRVFPGIEPIFGQERADHVKFSNGSEIISRSAGSKLTGRRADVLIVDDAHAGRAEAESPVQRRAVIQWFFGDCMSRLSKDAKVFIIGTRWHPSDLIGHLTSPDRVASITAQGQLGELYEVTNLRAISNGHDDPLGRAEGEALFPEERPISFLQALKAAMPGYEWSSQFDGEPRATASGQADLSKLKYIDAKNLPEGLTMSRGWDLAITEKQSADFTAGALCGWDGHNFYIVDMFARQWSWAKVRNAMIAQALADKTELGVQRCAVEGVGGFDAVYQDVKQALLGEVKVTKRNPPKGGKLLRAQPWLNLIEAGRVVIVRGPWNKDFLDELEQFPEAVHDDRVDACSVGYEDLTKPAPSLLVA